MFKQCKVEHKIQLGVRVAAHLIKLIGPFSSICFEISKAQRLFQASYHVFVNVNILTDKELAF